MNIFKAMAVTSVEEATRSIPVIDFGPAFRRESGGLDAVARDVRRACESIGFFYLAGHGVPHPGHFLSTKGSSPKAALFVTIVPEEVASERTRIDSMVIAKASPTLAPSTATGRVTSCPPRNSGVIIGPQQPGGTTQRMCPPSLIVAAKPKLGPTRPPVYSSTKTSFLMSLSIVCMRAISFRHTG